MITLGVIGDFGITSVNSISVSHLVKSWNPNAILTTGDNIYSPPSIKNYTSTLGTLYPEYLPEQKITRRINGMITESLLLHDISRKWKGKSCTARFLPCVGNHDFPFPSYRYTNYFQLPTFYSVEFAQPKNLLKVISLNNYKDEDGRFDDRRSNQRDWLEEVLERSQHFAWILVTFHYPQLCSNNSLEQNHTNAKRLFPFDKYKNVALVLNGHQHIYERLEVNGVTSVVVGTSGHSVRRKSQFLLKESRCIDDSGFGALRLDINENEIQGCYVALEGARHGQKREEFVKDEFFITRRNST